MYGDTVFSHEKCVFAQAECVAALPLLRDEQARKGAEDICRVVSIVGADPKLSLVVVGN